MTHSAWIKNCRLSVKYILISYDTSVYLDCAYDGGILHNVSVTFPWRIINIFSTIIFFSVYNIISFLAINYLW